MALAGISVVSGYAGFQGFAGANQTLFGNAEWSENLSAPGTGTKKARQGGSTVPKNFGRPVFRIFAVADSFVVIGKTPDINTGIKHFVKAGDYYDVVVNDGDTYAWALA